VLFKYCYCTKQIGHESYQDNPKQHKWLSYSEKMKSASYDQREIMRSEDYIGSFAFYEKSPVTAVFQNAQCNFGDYEINFSGRILTPIFENNKSQFDKEGDSAWLALVRDWATRHKGGASGFTAPDSKGFIYFPCIANQNQQKDQECLQRFKTNAVCSVGDHRTQSLFATLDLPIIAEFKRERPFGVLQVYIDTIHSISKKSTGESYTNINEQMGFFKRTPDFTFQNVFLCNAMMEAACEAAAPNVDKKFKDKCNELFPKISVKGMIPILFGDGDGSGNPIAKTTMTRTSPVEIWDLQLETPQLFNKKFHSRDRKYLAIWHIVDKKFLKASDLLVSPKTRGLEHKEGDVNDLKSNKNNVQMLQELAKHYGQKEVEIIILDISEMMNCDKEPTTPEEYCHQNGDLPSRHMIFKYQIENINVGTVEDVPLAHRTKRDIPLGKRKASGKGKDCLPYVNRQPHILGEYDEKMDLWKFNLNHVFVKKYFNAETLNVEINSKLHKKISDLYFLFDEQAKLIYRTFDHTGTQKKALNEPTVEGYDQDDVWDWNLNVFFNFFIDSDVVQKITTDLDQLIEIKSDIETKPDVVVEKQ
jgi:hypothetical protein